MPRPYENRHFPFPRRQKPLQSTACSPPDHHHTAASIYCSVVACATASARAAEIPARDRRSADVRHVDAHYTMPHYDTPQAWKERAAFLKKQILFSAGLWPMPQRTPLNPQVFGKVVHQDYSIEKLIIETHPGFYLGGNLYRPVGKPGPHPAVVSPHGHWRYGRIEHSEVASVPGRAIGLARLGFLVFNYDMVGFGDTMQIGHELQTKSEELWSIRLLELKPATDAEVITERQHSDDRRQTTE